MIDVKSDNLMVISSRFMIYISIAYRCTGRDLILYERFFTLVLE